MSFQYYAIIAGSLGCALPWNVGTQQLKAVDYGGMSNLPHDQSARITPVFEVQHAFWD
jgi:hypothetical protein